MIPFVSTYCICRLFFVSLSCNSKDVIPEVKINPEAKRFLEWIKETGKERMVHVQKQAEGQQTSVEDDDSLEALWMQFQLEENIKL